MSEDKQTFIDPKTGAEIESTKLAPWDSGLWTFIDPDTGEEIEITLLAVVLPVLVGYLGGCAMGLLVGLMVGLFRGWEYGALVGSSICIIWWVVGTIIRWVFGREIRQRIAHTQHRRRVLRAQDDQDVPDTALSRVQPPGDPQATDTALSLADSTDGADHLTGSIEEDTQAVVDDRP